MKIIVCVKQVPDTNEVRIDPVKGTLIREGVPSILNPDDASALEAALRLKDRDAQTEVAVLSMGPPQAMVMLRECLAMGADSAFLLSDRAFGGADTCATSSTLAAGVRAMGGADLVLAGRQAIDGDTAQVGPQLALRLGLPVVSYVQELEVSEGKAEVCRQLENGFERLSVDLPCVLTVIREGNEPRYMTVRGIVEAYEKRITVWGHEDIGLDPSECGLSASPTQVMRSFTPAPRQKGEVLRGSVREAAEQLAERLREKHLI